jgi:molecular chaperone GrpE
LMSKEGNHPLKTGENVESARSIGGKNRSFQKKKKESSGAALQKLQEENEGLRERLLRTAAELDNVLKRTEREKFNFIQSANAELLKSILPIMDDLDRSLKSFNETDPVGFRNGVELIQQKLISILKSKGLTEMETVGQTFDVDKHEALMQSKLEGDPPNKVVEEFEKGYLLNGLVLRHAKVMVSG